MWLIKWIKGLFTRVADRPDLPKADMPGPSGAPPSSGQSAPEAEGPAQDGAGSDLVDAGHGAFPGTIRFSTADVGGDLPYAPSGPEHPLMVREDGPSRDLFYSIETGRVPRGTHVAGILSRQIASLTGPKGRKTFSEVLVALVSSKCGGIAPTAYKRAGISRQAYSRIISSPNAGVDKLTSMRLCVGLQLNWEESVELLRRAGYAFSDTLPADIVFAYCIQHGIYDILVINDILAESGQKPFDIVA